MLCVLTAIASSQIYITKKWPTLCNFQNSIDQNWHSLKLWTSCVTFIDWTRSVLKDSFRGPLGFLKVVKNCFNNVTYEYKQLESMNALLNTLILWVLLRTINVHSFRGVFTDKLATPNPYLEPKRFGAERWVLPTCLQNCWETCCSERRGELQLTVLQNYCLCASAFAARWRHVTSINACKAGCHPAPQTAGLCSPQVTGHRRKKGVTHFSTFPSVRCCCCRPGPHVTDHYAAKICAPGDLLFGNWEHYQCCTCPCSRCARECPSFSDNVLE